ncbi:MAG: hypothetical protein HYZ93_04315 [Candidatus Omnitrophica bacterium]|nr:hypothetical protein [Candidatus Omnitrophota bacterium]
MPRWWDRCKGRLTVLKGLFRFLWRERLWWMIPLVGVLLLTGALLFVAQQSAVAPFIYTLF